MLALYFWLRYAVCICAVKTPISVQENQKFQKYIVEENAKFDHMEGFPRPTPIKLEQMCEYNVFYFPVWF